MSNTTKTTSGVELEQDIHLPDGSWLVLEGWVDGQVLKTPKQFLSTEVGKGSIQAIANSIGYRAWDSDAVSDLRWTDANRLADGILRARRAGRSPSSEIIKVLGDAADPYHHVIELGDGPIAALTEILQEAADDVGVRFGKLSTWREAIRDAVVTACAEQDTSTPFDGISSSLRAEIACWLIRPGLGWEDMPISSIEPWTTAETLLPNEGLAWALATLGHDLASFQAKFNNPVANPQYGSPFHGTPADNIAPRRAPVVNLEDIATLVENVCSRDFGICLYGIIPVRDLLDLNMKKPLVLEGARVAGYENLNGSFFDIGKPIERIELSPEECELRGCIGYSPIEDLVIRSYHARLRNAA